MPPATRDCAACVTGGGNPAPCLRCALGLGLALAQCPTHAMPCLRCSWSHWRRRCSALQRDRCRALGTATRLALPCESRKVGGGHLLDHTLELLHHVLLHHHGREDRRPLDARLQVEKGLGFRLELAGGTVARRVLRAGVRASRSTHRVGARRVRVGIRVRARARARARANPNQ